MGQAGHDAVTPLDAACEYVRRGWCVLPIPFKKKKTLQTGWRKLRLTEEELPQYFDQPANVGIALGEPSNWLVDVDLDCPEAIELADQFLPPTSAMTGRAGKPCSHRWYYAEGAKTKQHRDPI
ncbi:MAG: bifunctional DNA primase/polymerase, partial [Planctomycetaceae bacterium]